MFFPKLGMGTPATCPLLCPQPAFGAPSDDGAILDQAAETLVTLACVYGSFNLCGSSKRQHHMLRLTEQGKAYSKGSIRPRLYPKNAAMLPQNQTMYASYLSISESQGAVLGGYKRWCRARI